MLRNNRLHIFEDFAIDNCLPKHKKEEKSHSNFGASGTFVVSDGNIGSSNEMFASGGSWRIRIKTKATWFRELFKFKKSKKKEFITISQFFNSIKKAKTNLDIKDKDNLLGKYKTTIENAKVLGQVALGEKLIKNRDILLLEIKLLESNNVIYLKEDNIIDFYKETDETKKLKLVWIKNFTRVIPTNIIETKKTIDDLKVFDNYVILTFDPLDQMDEMTAKEIERAKDPILFGVIKGSDKLYYIADWEDEHCNLRLSDIIENHDPSTISNDSLNTYMK